MTHLESLILLCSSTQNKYITIVIQLPFNPIRLTSKTIQIKPWNTNYILPQLIDLYQGSLLRQTQQTMLCFMNRFFEVVFFGTKSWHFWWRSRKREDICSLIQGIFTLCLLAARIECDKTKSFFSQTDSEIGNSLKNSK